MAHERIYHNILFKTKAEYDKACELLSKPVEIEIAPAGRFKRAKTAKAVPLGAVGHSLGITNGEHNGRHTIWLIEYDEKTAEWWRLVQQILAPLNPVYTDDSGEAAQFLGR